MKKYIFIFMVVALPLIARSAENQIGIGVRGGVEWLMPQSNKPLSSPLSPAANFDLRYTCYGACSPHFFMGFTTGVSAGVAMPSLSGDFEQQYTNTDFLGNDLRYTTSASFKSSMLRLSLEMPLMLSMRASGFVLRAGPKVQFTPWAFLSKQQLKNPIVDAYYPLPDVHVVNELITGIVPEKECSKDNAWTYPLVQLAVGAEIGYEWCVKGKHHIGLVAYVDYGVWSTHRQHTTPIIDVSSITDPTSPIPVVTVHDAPSALVSTYHPLQAGLSLYYAFGRDKKHKQVTEPEIVYLTDTIVRVDTLRIRETDTVLINYFSCDTVYIRDTIVLKDTVIYIDTAVVQNRKLSDGEKDLIKAITKVNLSDIYFSTGQAVPTDAYAQANLNELSRLLLAYPNSRLRIIGHTDNTGTHTANVIVGQKRADAYKIELLRRGVPTNQVETTSMAEENPLYSNDTPQNRQRNRRVELQLL